MRYAPSLLDKLMNDALGERAGEVLPGLTIDEMKDSVAADLEALLNTRNALAEEQERAFPQCAGSVMNFGVVDFASKSLASEIDRDFVCEAIRRAIDRQEGRLKWVDVRLEASSQTGFNRLNFTIHATLRVSDVGEQVSFDARFEPTVQRYSIVRQRRPAKARVGAA